MNDEEIQHWLMFSGWANFADQSADGSFAYNGALTMNDDEYQWLLFAGWSNLAAPSPEGTVVYNNGASITDSSGAQWNVVNGVVKKNGVNVAFSNGVTELTWRNGTFVSFIAGPPSSIWGFDGSAWVNTIPWPQPVTDRLTFWGQNGHFWAGTAYSKDSQTVLKLVQSGTNSYRIGYAQGDIGRFKQFISAYAAPVHIAVYPVALVGAAADEDSAYAKGYSFGVEMGGLKNYVPYYELPNEYASYSINGGADGNLPAHYNAALYKVSRGIFRGVIDGVKSVDPTARFIGPAETWLHTGFSDMLWNGTSPDNSSANTALQVRWDITTWHWYSNMGNIEAAGGPSMNVLQTLKDNYGKPIRINEYGCYASSFSDEVAIATYLTGANLMGKWDSKRATYNITGCDNYELFDDGSGGDEGNFGIVQSDAFVNKTRYSAFAAYIVAHQ